MKPVHPSRFEGVEGTPIKDIQEGAPIKDIQSGDRDEELFLENQETPDPKKSAITAETIYEAYPRKMGRKDALKAIGPAMKSKSPEMLLERTIAYAEATSRWIDEDKKYIPHPAKWFKRESFDDDPKEWERQPSHGASRPHTNGGHPFQMKKSDHSKGF